MVPAAAAAAAAAAPSPPLHAHRTLRVCYGAVHVCSWVHAGVEVSRKLRAAIVAGLIAVMPDPGISVHFRMMEDGATALHISAQHGSLHAAHFLLENGAALDLQDLVKGWTPLHYAAANQQLKVAEALLEHRAPADAVDWLGRRPDQLVPDQRSALCGALRVAMASKK